MRLLICLFAFIFFSDSLIAAENFEVSLDNFLKKYVSDGQVDYSSIKSNKGELDALVLSITNYNLSNKKPEETKAFYLNAYNILVINGVVKNYPLKSPLDVKGFFDKIKYQIAGEFLTLNEIENLKIREVYIDPRIHFALVCAAKGCPKIGNEAFNAEDLNAQLHEKSKTAINDPNFIRYDQSKNTVLISEIFKWYAEDFGGNENYISYLNKFRDNKIPSSTALDFYEYDWSLNEKK